MEQSFCSNHHLITSHAIAAKEGYSNCSGDLADMEGKKLAAGQLNGCETNTAVKIARIWYDYKGVYRAAVDYV